jgi:predicted trehalose synthase
MLPTDLQLEALNRIFDVLKSQNASLKTIGEAVGEIHAACVDDGSDKESPLADVLRQLVAKLDVQTAAIERLTEQLKQRPL